MAFDTYYFAPLGLRSIVISLFVRLSLCSHNSETVRPNFTKCFVHVACGRRSALWYVVYFRFCGWRHVFIPWDL